MEQEEDGRYIAEIDQLPGVLVYGIGLALSLYFDFLALFFF